MIRNDDPIKLWEQDGDLERMLVFFGGITEDGRKDRIKQLVLAKLAEEEAGLNNAGIAARSLTAEPSTEPAAAGYGEADPEKVNDSKLNSSAKNRVFEKLNPKNWQGMKRFWQNSWQRWRWKMALPVAALALIAVIGQQGLLDNFSLNMKSTEVAADSAYSGGGAGIMNMADEGTASHNVLMSGQAAPSVDSKFSGNAVLPPILPEPEAPPADKGLPRKITHNLNTSLEVADLEKAVDELTALAQSHGGYIVDSQIYNQEYNAYARISMKIPAEKLEGIKGSLKEIGKVLNQHLTANDISNQYYDAEARLRNLQAQEHRYLEILQDADTVGDILQVEGALNNIRMQIEQLQGQLKLWDHEVAYSSLVAELYTKDSPVAVNNPWQPISLKETWQAAKDAVLKSISSIWNGFNYLIVGLGYALPVIIVLGIAYPVYRSRKKKKVDKS